MSFLLEPRLSAPTSVFGGTTRPCECHTRALLNECNPLGSNRTMRQRYYRMLYTKLTTLKASTGAKDCCRHEETTNAEVEGRLETLIEQPDCRLPLTHGSTHPASTAPRRLDATVPPPRLARARPSSDLCACLTSQFTCQQQTAVH